MHIVVPFMRHKKQLKETLSRGETVFFRDPDVVAPHSRYAHQIEEGEEITVTNHPKRSWYAVVSRSDGKLEVR